MDKQLYAHILSIVLRGSGEGRSSSLTGGGRGGRRGSAEKEKELQPPHACRSRGSSLVVNGSLSLFRRVVKQKRPNPRNAIEGEDDTKAIKEF
ncbi:hypothetical protein SK128_014139 [Halocaridina rubra]|uniref:Uncharacterized protein n=1 Tax=Halocaridina rubra TaxID=373956 RepID=A0AAN8X7A9_HALRR